MSRTPIATSAFTGTDGAVPTNFTSLDDNNGQVQIAGNKYHSPYSGYSEAVWSGAGSFTADQYAKSVLSGLTGLANGDAIGVTCRQSNDTFGARDGYRAYVTDGLTTVLTLEKIVNDTITSLGTNSAQAWANTDTVECEAIGTTITALRNGVVVITVTDSSLSTGKPGIIGHAGLMDSVRGDDWEGGNSAAGGGAVKRNNLALMGAGR